MRAAADVDVHARQHARRPPRSRATSSIRRSSQSESATMPAMPARHGLLDLAAALGDAVEHGLIRREPSAQRLPQLAAGVDLHARPGCADLLEEPEVGARLAGEEHAAGGVPGLERPPQAATFSAMRACEYEEERRVDPAGQAGDVDAVEEQPPAPRPSPCPPCVSSRSSLPPGRQPSRTCAPAKP